MCKGKEMCLPAKRFHEIFFQKVVIFFHWSNVNGELRIWVDESIKSVDFPASLLKMNRMKGKKRVKTAFLLDIIRRPGKGVGG